MHDFTGRTVLVTGAAAGIGNAIASRFADSGAAVALFDVDAASLEGTVDELRARSSAAVIGIPGT